MEFSSRDFQGYYSWFDRYLKAQLFTSCLSLRWFLVLKFSEFKTWVNPLRISSNSTRTSLISRSDLSPSWNYAIRFHFDIIETREHELICVWRDLDFSLNFRLLCELKMCVCYWRSTLWQSFAECLRSSPEKF